MAIPAHEMLPSDSTKGRKPGSTQALVLNRIVKIGYLIDVEGWTLSQIYEWQNRPVLTKEEMLETGEQSGGGWNYSFREISGLMKRARELGSALLHDDRRRNTISTLRQYYDLKRKALAGGDFRVAFLCVREIAKIRGINPDGRGKSSSAPKGASIAWREVISDAPAEVQSDVTEEETLVGLS